MFEYYRTLASQAIAAANQAIDDAIDSAGNIEDTTRAYRKAAYVAVVNAQLSVQAIINVADPLLGASDGMAGASFGPDMVRFINGQVAANKAVSEAIDVRGYLARTAFNINSVQT